MVIYSKAFDEASLERVKERLGLEEEPNWQALFQLDLSEIKFIECLGCGAYAEVWLCLLEGKDLVALKIEGIPDQKGELQGNLIVFFFRFLFFFLFSSFMFLFLLLLSQHFIRIGFT